MSGKITCCCSEWESDSGEHQLSIVSKSPEFLTDDQKRQIAIEGVQAILNEHNITADELPCLGNKTKTARDCEEYIASWRDPILTKILTYNKEDCEWFDDIHNEYNQPDYIMPIPPLPGEKS